MEYRVNYTVVGFFVVMLVLASIVMAFWISSSDPAKDYKTYAIYMKESVYGLTEQAPVKFNGVTIGYVDNIHLNPHNLQEVRVLIRVENEVPITQTTVASLQSQGITGITYLGLQAKTPDAPLLEKQPGQKYAVIPSEPSFLLQISDAIRDATTNLNAISENINKLLSQKNVESVSNSLENITKFTKVLADNQHEIDSGFKNANLMLQNTEKATKELPELIKKVDHTVAVIEEVAKSFEQTSKDVQVTVKDSRVAVQSLSQQAIPSIIQLIHRLESVASNVQTLTGELKHNPSMLVRGKAPTPAGPGE